MAGSIKFLQLVKNCSQIMGIHSTQSNPNRPTNLLRTIFLIGLVQYLFATASFLVFEAKSMFDYGFGFCMPLCVTNAIAVYLTFIWQSENTWKFTENCEGFIEKRVQSTVAYEETTGKIELFNKFLFFVLGGTIAFLLFSPAPYTLVRYYVFDMGVDSYFLFTPAWYPFDWKTPFGYLVAWLAQCAGAAPVACIIIQFFNLLIGSCWLFIFVAEDITRDVAAFNTTVAIKNDENRTELTTRFHDIIQIFTDAKQCILQFNQIVKYSLFAFFSWTFFGIADILVAVQFQLWSGEANSFEIALLSFVLIWMYIYLFILCEPGEQVINQFEGFSDGLCECGWYLLPIGMQRKYLIFLLNTQYPIILRSFANVTSERETMKKICNGSFSYFMTLRRFRT